MSLANLTIGEISGVLKLKVMAINPMGPHRFLDVIDASKNKTTLVVWKSEQYIVDQMEIKKWYNFNKLTVRKNWAPPGKETPEGYQLIFLPANGASIEGIEVKEVSLFKGPPEIKVGGIKRFIDSLPVLMTKQVVEIKAGELKLVETGSSLVEKAQANMHFEFKVFPALVESGLTIPNVLVPNVAEEIFVPVYNPLKKMIKQA